MRTLRYLPLAYLCGVHGFAFFAPYLAMFLAAAHLMHRRRMATVSVPVKI